MWTNPWKTCTGFVFGNSFLNWSWFEQKCQLLDPCPVLVDVALSFPQHVGERAVVRAVERNVFGELRAEAEERDVNHTTPCARTIHGSAFRLSSLWYRFQGHLNLKICFPTQISSLPLEYSTQFIFSFSLMLICFFTNDYVQECWLIRSKFENLEQTLELIWIKLTAVFNV